MRRSYDRLISTMEFPILARWHLYIELGCLRLRQWPVTYLMTLIDWTMSCQPGPPRARHGQWPRWQQRPVGYTFSYKMANFYGVYLKLGRIDSAEFFIWYCEKYLSHCHRISKWYDQPMVCYSWVEISNFAMSKQGPGHYFHLHARVPPTAVPGYVDERIGALLMNKDQKTGKQCGDCVLYKHR